MSERWEPKCGETYYYVNAVGVVSAYVWHDDSTDDLYYKSGNCFKTKAEAKVAAKQYMDLLLNLHESTKDCNQLPKLTAEVFDRPDCPKWAKYVAVDGDGIACYFSAKPTITHGENFWARRYQYTPVSFSDKYDASDWRNSLIERSGKETKLPDWCNVGEWVYNKDFHEYIKVVERTHDEVKGKDIHGGVYYADFHFQNTVPARLRPYNAEEMRGLVGILIRKGPSLHIVTGYENVIDGECMVHVNGCLYSANDLLRQFAIDNEPCGVLEHLNEKGEWVE